MRIPATKASVGNREAELERRIAAMERAMRSVKTAQQDPTRLILSQSAHGFSAGNVIRHNGTIWVKSKADTAANAVVGGVVASVLSPDVFVLASSGYVSGISGIISAGAVHYLDASTDGGMTVVAPAISIPVLLATSATDGILIGSVGASPFSLTGTDWTLLGSSPYTLVGTKRFRRFMVIGGGGGGGGHYSQVQLGYISSVAGTWTASYFGGQAHGAGGDAGSTVIVDVDCQGISTVSFSAGSAGTSGTTGSPGTDGGAGGDSTLTVGTTVVRAKGGAGGRAASATQPGIGGSPNTSGGSISAGSAPAAVVAIMHGQAGSPGGFDLLTSSGSAVMLAGTESYARSAGGYLSGTPGDGGKPLSAGYAGRVYIAG